MLPPGGGRPISHIEIIGRGKQTGLLLCDYESLGSQWKNPEKTILYNTITLNSIPYNDRSPDQFISVKISPFKKKVFADNIFADNLFFVLGENKFPGSVIIPGAENLRFKSNSKLTPIIPLKEQILDCYSSEELGQRTRFRQLSDDEIEVSLRATLSGDQSGYKELYLTKKYKGPTIKIIDNVPVVEVWPNIEDEDGLWKLYYAYIYGDFASHKIFNAIPYIYGEKAKKKELSAKAAIYTSSLMPEAFICSAPIVEEIGGHASFINKDAGVIFLTPPNKYSRKRQIDIGIDFGTSNSQVYISSRPGSLSPIKFENRLKHVTEPGVLRSQLFEEFFPEKQIVPPFRSLFKINTKYTSDKTEIKPVEEGIIYYPNIQKLEEITSSLLSYLKWGQDKLTQAAAIAFLSQIYIQCAAEANAQEAKSINWKAAFPTAFSKEQEEAITNAWGRIVTGLKDHIGYSDGFVFESESHAAAKYFADIHKATIAYKGAVCIDIGGGTSDVAVWYGEDNQLVNQVSLLFAGRHMLFDMVDNNYSRLSVLLEYVNKAYELNTNFNQEKSKEIDFYTWLESFIKLNGNDIIDKLPTFAITDKRLKDIVNIIEFGLSGLFYYIGLMLKVLGPTQEKILADIPDFFIGGNGSNLLKWNIGGIFNSECQSHQKYTDVIKQSSRLVDSGFRIELSNSPKNEVAYGLVSNYQLTYPKVKTRSAQGVISGENIIIDEQMFPWNENIDSIKFTKIIKFDEKPLENIFSFLDMYEEKWKLPLNERSKKRKIEDIKKEMVAKVKQRLTDKRLTGEKKPEDKIQVEPIFIIALKCFLKYYCY